MIETLTVPPPARLQRTRPRLGFLGVGWIGRNRMEAVARSGLADIVAIADDSHEMAAKAQAVVPDAERVKDFRGLDLDGIVIATPSALHAEQAATALEAGAAVFCQKPLGRTAAETRYVIETARAANRLLGVDLSYRFVTEIEAVRKAIDSRKIFSTELTFHNAYGPDKPWFYDCKLSGGGCVIDLGIHLVDLALWMLGSPEVINVSSRMFTRGKPIRGRCEQVEDYAVARLDLSSGAVVQVACSWKLHAGCDALISGAFYGIDGGAAFKNLNGSFYRFTAEQFSGTNRQLLAATNEDWGGRAAVDWVRRLSISTEYDPEIERSIKVAETLDAIYEA